MQVKFKRNKCGDCSFQFNNLTQGRAIALLNAIYLYSQQSAVCEDLIIPTANVIHNSKSLKFRKEDDDLFNLIKRNIKENKNGKTN